MTIYNLVIPEERTDKQSGEVKTYWHRVGTAFTQKSGKGFNLVIPERRKKQLSEQARADRAASLSTTPFIDRNKTGKPDFRQANTNAPETIRKARTEAKASPRAAPPENSVKAPQRENLTPAEPSERLSLDDKKTITDARLGEHGKLSKPWERSSLKEDRARPWERDDKPAGRERRPSGAKPKGGGGGKPS